VHERTSVLTQYMIAEHAAPSLASIGSHWLDGMAIDIIDPVEDYAQLMQKLFDFDALAALAKRGFRLHFDALNGITGPYARHIFNGLLGFPESSLACCSPLPNFGQQNPDPNPVYAGRFHLAMMNRVLADFGAASDSDGDRHMVMGPGIFVTPSDSLAILAQHMHLAPAYSAGPAGVARSVGTSTAIDRVAASLGVSCHETPTGWRYFGNLLDAGLISLCGEESSGAGSTHIREKDGLWAILLWLNIIAKSGLSVSELVERLWRQHGRTYYTRLDYEDVDADACLDLMTRLRSRLCRLVGRSSSLGEITAADDFCYADPVDGSVSPQQGVRISVASGARMVLRLSGTGTEGATLRLYCERHDLHQFDRSVAEYLEPVIAIADQIAAITLHTRRIEPTLVT
jgi:phosphoglucomutase